MTSAFLLLVALEVSIVGICLYPIYKIKDSVYRFGFYLSNATILFFFHFSLTVNLGFSAVTADIIKKFTLPLKKILNETQLLQNFYFDPEFLQKNVLFIDVSRDYVPSNLPTNGQRRFSADRKKLLKMLQLIDQNRSQIRFLACDLFLQDLWSKDEADNETDKQIRDLLEEFGNSNKLVQAVLSSEEGREGIKKTRILSGAVDSNKNGEPSYFASLIPEDGSVFFPYEMYRLETGIVSHRITSVLPYDLIYEDHNGKGFNLATNDFFPEFYFSEDDATSRKSEFLFMGSILENPQLYKFSIERSRGEPLPIVIIGCFNGEFDVHDTSYGKMHGGFFLANVYHSILKGQHLVTFWYAIFAFLSFGGLSYLILGSAVKSYDNKKETDVSFFVVEMLRNAASKNRNSLPNRYISNSIRKIFAYFLIIFYSIARMIFDNVIYVLLFCMVVVGDLFFNKVANIIGLSVYIFCFKAIVSELIKFELFFERRFGAKRKGDFENVV